MDTYSAASVAALGVIYAATGAIGMAHRLPGSWARMGLIAAGALCTAATLGPLLGRMQLQFLGIFGYAFLLPALCVLIALVFARAGQAADSALAL